MKKFVLAMTALTALAATPALAGNTHISFGVYSPAPVAYYPAYAPVVRYVPYSYHYHGPRWADRYEWRGHHRDAHRHDRRDYRRHDHRDGRGRH